MFEQRNAQRVSYVTYMWEFTEKSSFNQENAQWPQTFFLSQVFVFVCIWGIQFDLMLYGDVKLFSWLFDQKKISSQLFW